MLKDKIRIVSLPIGGPDESERRVFSPKGELAQIVNGRLWDRPEYKVRARVT